MFTNFWVQTEKQTGQNQYKARSTDVGALKGAEQSLKLILHVPDVWLAFELFASFSFQ